MARWWWSLVALVSCAAPARAPVPVVTVPSATSGAPPTKPPPPRARGESTVSVIPGPGDGLSTNEIRGNTSRALLDRARVHTCYQETLARDPGITGWMIVQQSQRPGEQALSLVEQEGLPEALIACVMAARAEPRESPFDGNLRMLLHVRFR